MRRFKYKAKDAQTGKMINGIIQAESERAAGALLVDQGYIPDKITEEGHGGFFANLFNQITTKDKVTFSRQFATLIGAGLPLSTSLKTVAEQTNSKAMRSVVEDILASVEAGKSLADAMEKHPKVFDNVYLSLVRAGETSGTLDQALRDLAEQQEKDAAMISKIRGAMIYPAIIMVVIILVLVFMMTTVVPQVSNLYRDMKKPLPGLTSFLVGMSNFFAQWWWLVLIIIGIIVFVFIQYRRTPAGRRMIDGFKLNVPIFKGLFLRLYMTRFAKTAQMLLGVGVSMLDAMQIAAKAVNNVVVEEQILKAADQVKGGKALSDALKGRDYILPLVPQMANIGEQSGKIDEMLGRAGKVYETELDEKIASISTLIEPVLMVAMAGLIAIVIGGTLLPIYTLVSSI